MAKGDFCTGLSCVLNTLSLHQEVMMTHALIASSLDYCNVLYMARTWRAFRRCRWFGHLHTPFSLTNLLETIWSKLIFVLPVVKYHKRWSCWQITDQAARMFSPSVYGHLQLQKQKWEATSMLMNYQKVRWSTRYYQWGSGPSPTEMTV